MANSIDSAAKRSKLAPRREPYWARIKSGGFVGYRCLSSGEGSWIARWRDEQGKQHYRALGAFADYDDAAKAARAWIEQNEGGVAPKQVTVDAVCRSYLEGLRLNQKTSAAKDAEGRFRRLVFNTDFGRLAIDKLKPAHIRAWLAKQIEGGEDDDEDDLRRAKDSANRNLSALKAALNQAVADRVVGSDSGWKSVKAFKDVARRRQDAFLSRTDRQALLDACPDDLRRLCQALLLTGCRPGEIAGLDASDYDRKQGTLTIRKSKTGARVVALSSAAAAFFEDQTKDRIGSAPMLCRTDGVRWSKDAWKDPFKEAVKAAGLSVAVVLYSLRHTAISEMVMGGVDVFLVAKLAGTSVAMIEKNYGHLRHETVRDKLDAVRIV